MKKFICTIALASATLSAMAQAPISTEAKGPYQFTDLKVVEASPVKDQSSSGTCWSFAGLGLLESELLRQGKGEYDLSEMWVVRHAYIEKAIKYIRMYGNANFGAGGSTDDVFSMIEKYGIVPEEVYSGLNYGTQMHRHGELDAALTAYVKSIAKNPNKKLTTAWIDGFCGILDAYLGEAPETFVYKGVEYTPKSFAESLGLDMDDYVELTSFSHHPFYTQFAVEVPDNWNWALSYNLPFEEMMQVLDYALENGYAVNWSADVSEEGFDYMNGYSIVPADPTAGFTDTEKARWVNLSAKERQARMGKLTEPAEEREITQQMRQEAFDNWETTDDHGMLITGIAEDQLGNRFYKVKNSWGTDQVYGGYFYASRPYVEYKTMGIAMHKDALPKEIRKKLNIK